MVKVYLESDNCSDLIAVFEDEGTYIKCLPSLKAMATESRMRITESVTEHSIQDLLPVKSYIEEHIEQLTEIRAKVLYDHKNKPNMSREWAEDNISFMRELKGRIDELKTVLKHSL